MDEIATINASLAEAKQRAEEAGGQDEELNKAVATLEAELTAKTPQDPVKTELEKHKNKGKTLTKRERLEFARSKIDGQLSELDAADGIVVEDKNTPVTVEMLERREREQAQKTALELAEGIDDEAERELTKVYLKERVRPSGNPHEDLKFARAAVNSLRNAHIAEEAERARKAKGTQSAPGAPAKVEQVFEPTAEELRFMKPPFNLTKEQVLANRAKQQ